MDKLKLDLDDLEVQSFETEDSSESEGTMHGQGSTFPECCDPIPTTATNYE